MISTEKILQVKDLSVSFRTISGTVYAVRGVSFDLHKGETLAIVGESGSGKSVTNRAVMGILTKNASIDGGEIIYKDEDILHYSDQEFANKIRGTAISMKNMGRYLRLFSTSLTSFAWMMASGAPVEVMMISASARRSNRLSKATASPLNWRARAALRS